MRALLAAVNCQKGDLELNYRTHRAVVDEAARARCDIAVFPEMSLTGYLDPRRADHTPVSLDSGPVTRMCELSRESGLDLLFGISESNDSGPPFITQVLAGDGAVKAAYRKRHLGEGEEAYTPGTDSVVTATGADRFGIAICADRSWPDEFEFAASNGAKVVFHPSAPGLDPPRRTDDASWKRGFDWWRDSCIEIHRSHARSLGITIAVATQAGSTENEDFPGWAAVIGPDGHVRAELPDWRAGTLVVEV